MTTEQMRTAIGEVYSSDSWNAKVKKMPDDQVVAIYYKFLAAGKFEKKSVNSRKDDSIESACGAAGENLVGGRKYEQISVFELM